MRLRKVAALIFLGLTTVSSWCGAFEYVSKEGGFSIAIPERYSLFVTKDAVVAMDSASGIHSFVSREMQKDGKTFTTSEFATLLQAMDKDIKAGKDVLREPAYAFLSQSQKPWGHKLVQDLSGAGKFTYQITKVAGVPALAYQNATEINYKVQLPEPFTREQQEQSKKQQPGVEFSADGKEMQLKLKVIADNYLLSQHDRLLQIGNGYTQEGELWRNSREKLEETLGKKLGLLAQEPFSLGAYKKANRNFARSVQFFAPQASNEPLLIKDTVFQKEYRVPHTWMYAFTQGNNAGMAYSAFGALPYAGIEKYLETQLGPDSQLQVTTQDRQLNITSNLANIDTQAALSLYQEGLLSVSVKFAPQEGDKFGSFLKNPELTKLVFEKFMQKPVLQAATRTRLEQIFKMSNLQSKMDINPDNAMVHMDGHLELHLPRNTMVMRQQGYDIFTDKQLVPFTTDFQAQLYFNKQNMFNGLCYLHKQGQSPDTVITGTIRQFDLYRQPLLREASVKL